LTSIRCILSEWQAPGFCVLVAIAELFLQVRIVELQTGRLILSRACRELRIQGLRNTRGTSSIGRLKEESTRVEEGAKYRRFQNGDTSCNIAAAGNSEKRYISKNEDGYKGDDLSAKENSHTSDDEQRGRRPFQ
jgi:hypothetical protein